MIVVAHYCVCQQIYCEDLGQLDKTIFNPAPAMIKVLASELIVTAQKCPPHAARGAMVVHGMVQADLLAPGYRHVDSVLWNQLARTCILTDRPPWVSSDHSRL